MLEKKGLVKLVEECGELIQIAAKKMTRMDSDEHWDGKGSLSARLEEELGDVHAAIGIVITNFELSHHRVLDRSKEKTRLFEEWMEEGGDEDHADWLQSAQTPKILAKLDPEWDGQRAANRRRSTNVI